MDQKKRIIIATNVKTGESQRFETMSMAERTLKVKRIGRVLSGKLDRINEYTFRYDEETT